VFKHLVSSPRCKQIASKDSFVILDTAVNAYQLKIKEALFINTCKKAQQKKVER